MQVLIKEGMMLIWVLIKGFKKAQRKKLFISPKQICIKGKSIEKIDLLEDKLEGGKEILEEHKEKQGEHKEKQGEPQEKQGEHKETQEEGRENSVGFRKI